MKTGFTGKRYFYWLGRKLGLRAIPIKYLDWPEYAKQAYLRGAIQVFEF